MKKILNLKSIVILLFLLFIYTFFCAFSYTKAITNNLSENIFRLHVIANSNSKEDQDLKLKVKEELINYMNYICKNCKTKNEAVEIAKNNKDTFCEIAQKTIYTNGYNYEINIEFGNFNFPTKEYGDITLPAGNYDALKVKIGKAKGKNWWCVMFPPLCFIDINSGIIPDSSKEQLKTNLNNEEYTLISTKNNNQINFKFKILELFNIGNLITAKK